MRPVYLDNNATTRMDSRVLDAMLPYFTEQFGNASSAHAFGASVSPAIKEARQRVAALLGAAFDHEIIFTSGGTESDNTAILSALEAQPAPKGACSKLETGDAEASPGRSEMVISAVEHPAVLSLADYLEKQRGVTVHRIPVDTQWRLDLDAYKRALGPLTALVSIMWANNETGTLFPVAELSQLAHAAGALFHTDAVQAAGKLPISLQSTEIDMLSLSGHKLHAPKGIGVLYVRKGVRFQALIRGGRQERGRRGGTENVPAIVALGVAAKLAAEHLAGEQTRVKALRDRFEAGVLSQISDCFVNGDLDARLPNTSNIAFDCAESETLLIGLNKAGIAVSSGSACTAGSTEPSHVLRAMNVGYTAIHGAIRFSFSRDNAEADVDRVLEVLPEIVAKAREVSPFAASRGQAA
jgi:cysteine desulfurase